MKEGATLEQQLRARYGVEPPLSVEESAQLGVAAAQGVIDLPESVAEALLDSPGPAVSPPKAGDAPEGDPGLGIVCAGTDRIRHSYLEAMQGIVPELENDINTCKMGIEEARSRQHSLLVRVPVIRRRIGQAENLQAGTLTVAQASSEPHGWMRTLPSRIYLPFLALLALVSGFLNSSAFQVFRQSMAWTLLAALGLAAIFALATHSIGLGAAARNGRHRDRFTFAVVGAVLLLIATIAIAQIRSDFLVVTGKPSDLWTFLVIQLFIDVAGLLAACLHANRNADAIAASTQEVDDAHGDAVDLMGQIEDAKHEEKGLEQEIASAVERHIAFGRRIQEQQKEAIGAFCLALGRTLGATRAAPLLARIDTSADWPERLAEYEAWRDSRADDLDRPRRLRPMEPWGLGPGSGA